MRKLIADVFVIGGIALCAAGAWLAWPPLGLAAAGVGLVVFGVFVTMGDA